MSVQASHVGEGVRSAELVATLCLATDLGMGFPFEHGLHTTLIAMRLGEQLGVDGSTASQTYYACLLAHAGCTTDAHVGAEVFGGSLTTHFNPVMYGSGREVLAGLMRALPPPEIEGPMRAVAVVRRLPRMAREQRPHLTASCEVAQMLAERVGGPPEMQPLLAHLFERWDGRGPLGRAKGDEIPLAMRIVAVAVDASFQRLLGDVDHVVRVIGERAGHAFDPEIAACFVDGAQEILALDQVGSTWEETLACEPKPTRGLQGDALERALAAIGDFADLISPYLSGHSAGVAKLAGAAAAQCRFDPAGVTTIRRAALLHDLGRVAVHPRIWQKPGPLTADEWEQVRLHPYHTQRVVSRAPFLTTLAGVAGAHHERLDGSGYHRGAVGPELALAARLLAAADAYHAMTEPRSHREALAPERAAAELAREARAGRLDAEAVRAVLESGGQRAPRLERPAGLSEREAEVVAMLARGLQTKQVARALGISVKTADRHVQNAYRKIGVSTRAAATLFAMEHGLIAWGELPIARPAART
ncbi:MAG TPA: HD domain-containing phosphohydrolase [Solirubrobacteraceae bacterium]|nr:HD domain-containing phosphohydrolase [Solirubrobacteraceae bacterium]